MNEYQDQETWFEVWMSDEFQWNFMADFDTRPEAESYAFRVCEGESYRIKRVSGLAA